MSNEIVKRSSDGLIIHSEKSRVACVESYQENLNMPAVLGHLARYANLSSIVSAVKKGTQYIVQVPTHLQAAIDAGKYTMLHGEQSGKTWATIVEKLPNGKNEFIANCPIKEEAFLPGNPMQEMSNSFANLQMQKQMAALAQLLGETYDAILRVEAGQKADRIGQLNAGRDGIIYALAMEDEDSKKLQIVVARGSLQEAQSKIAEILKIKVESFKALPKQALMRFVLECTHDGYLDKRDDEYDTIRDYFELYVQATKLIGESYMICGEEKSAALVFDESRRFVQTLDFSKVSTILYSHPKMNANELVANMAVSNIGAEKVMCLDAVKPHDYIEITLDGEDILEVIEHAE